MIKIDGIKFKTEQDVLNQINRNITHPPENSRVVEFTPKISETVLEDLNIDNRPRKPKKIQQYAEDMKADRWSLNGETIKFSDAGVLRDGQNRLAACVRARKPFTTHVVFGIPDASFHRMDIGKPRSGSDVLHIAGYQNSTMLAAALRWAWILDNNPLGRGQTLTNEQCLDLVQNGYKGMPASIPWARKIYHQYHHPIGQVAALHHIFARRNAAKADEFIELWARGVQAGRARPIAKLQDYLAQIKTQNFGRIHDVVRAAMIVNAWNLFLQGRGGSKRAIAWTFDQEFPQI